MRVFRIKDDLEEVVNNLINDKHIFVHSFMLKSFVCLPCCDGLEFIESILSRSF